MKRKEEEQRGKKKVEGVNMALQKEDSRVVLQEHAQVPLGTRTS